MYSQRCRPLTLFAAVGQHDKYRHHEHAVAGSLV